MSNQHLVKRLQSGDVEARREAARSLAQIPSMRFLMERDERDISDAIASLAEALLDRDAEVRKQAAVALRAAVSDSQDISAAIPILTQNLSDEQPDARRSAVLVLRDAVTHGLDAALFEARLFELLQDQVKEIRWGSADTLAYHLAAKSQWNTLRELLCHTDPDIAQETAGTLAQFAHRLDYRPVMPTLIALLTAESPELPLVVAKAITNRPRNAADLSAAIPVLFHNLTSKQARIRGEAIRTLRWAVPILLERLPGAAGGKVLQAANRELLAPLVESLPTLRRALSDSEGAAQAAAVEILGAWLAALPVSHPDYDQDLRSLEELLSSGGEAVREATAKILTIQWLRSGQWDQLSDLLTNQPAEIRRQTLHTLANGDAAGRPGFMPLVTTIMAILSGDDGDLGYAAGRALQRVNPNEILGPLEAGPIDTEAWWNTLLEVRRQVHFGLLDPMEREWGVKEGNERVSYLAERLTHPVATIRTWASKTLEWVAHTQDTTAAIPLLHQLLDDLDPATRAAAASALGTAAKHSSIRCAHGALVGLAGDGSGRVRHNALWALWMSADKGGDLSAVLPQLSQLLRHAPDQEDRAEAASALSAAAIAGSDLQPLVSALGAALQDAFARVRFYAARALHYAVEGGSDIQQVIPGLVGALRDPDHTVGDWAVAALELYASDSTRAGEVLSSLKALDKQCTRAKQVARHCESKLGDVDLQWLRKTGMGQDRDRPAGTRDNHTGLR